MAELVVALDYPELAPALSLVERLRERVTWFKIGLELFSAHGPEAVQQVRSLGGKVFLDLKLMDIPHTVRAAAMVATQLGAGMFTIHLSGGRRMVQAALQGRNQGLSPGSPPTLVLGVTLLTSLDRTDLNWMGEHEPGKLVLQLADSGRKWGIDGLVCSAQEVGQVKALVGGSCVCVTPGIRMSTPESLPKSLPEPLPDDDQSRASTPSSAVAAGSDYLVVGRPITSAQDPLQAVDAFLAAIGSDFQGT
jgi:orotidine-5'-phosphate decarboxylase